MRTLLIFAALILSLAVNSCGTQNKSKQYDKRYEDAFSESFKTLSFCKCLEYGYSKKIDLPSEDASCRYPDYLYGEGSLIDSLARLESLKSGKILLRVLGEWPKVWRARK
ncbi:hypothetical protein [Pontibacter anaerobius]|uniref:Lipoprotein n=1 Tax=Pontibacter anaerobius TaxID=2993940 RepID=A0ABT3RKL8_9BACT|nr:hypothetical protein [Pontibacter anaerobius]MCX2742110.1 hypothetical protein [Pontibacter anaerobius]